MNKFLTIVIAAIAIMLAGCAGSYSKDYRAYLAAESTKPGPEKKPLLKITAQEGQSITGLASIEVYAPDGEAVAAANRIAAPIPQESPAIQIAKIAVGGLTGLAAPAASAYGMRQSTLLGIAQSNNSVRGAESNNAMLGGMFANATSSNATIATNGFGAMERGFGRAFDAAVTLGTKPTTQITNNGEGNNVVIGQGNTTQSGRDNRQASPGPCTNTPTVTVTTPAPAPASGDTPVTPTPTPAPVTVTGSVPCTTN